MKTPPTSERMAVDYYAKCGWPVEDDKANSSEFACGVRAERDRALGDPVPMLLHCPSCGERHIDEGAFADKPHHTHACQFCGMTWRPAIIYTVGVQFLPGFANEITPVRGSGTSKDRDQQYLAGERSAYVRLLQECCKTLGFRNNKSPQSQVAALLNERTQAITKLREFFSEEENETWDDQMQLVDILELLDECQREADTSEEPTSDRRELRRPAVVAHVDNGGGGSSLEILWPDMRLLIHRRGYGPCAL